MAVAEDIRASSETLLKGHAHKRPANMGQFLRWSILFLGGWGVPFSWFGWDTIDSIDNWMNVVGPVIMLTKMMLLVGIIMWVRFSYPRFREDQLQTLAWTWLIPLALAIADAGDSTDSTPPKARLRSGAASRSNRVASLGANTMVMIAANSASPVPGSRPLNPIATSGRGRADDCTRATAAASVVPSPDWASTRSSEISLRFRGSSPVFSISIVK